MDDTTNDAARVGRALEDWPPMLGDDEIDAVFNQMPDGPQGFCKSWGYRQFAREIEALVRDRGVDELSRENQALRVILSKVTTALGTGAFASSACSLHFLSHIPDEVRLTVERLRTGKASTGEEG